MKTYYNVRLITDNSILLETNNVEKAYDMCISTPNSIIYDIDDNPLMHNL